MKISQKILGLAILSSVATALIVVATVFATTGGFTIVRESCQEMASRKCEIVAENATLMANIHNLTINKKVQNELNVARSLLGSENSVSFDTTLVEWNAMNQFTQENTKLALPKMLVNGEWLGQNASFDRRSPVVDPLQDLVGGTCTIFQRMNEAGDLLRVCTNVRKKDDTRAIGTYIPATNPDGTPNKVVHTILRGETYVGRAYVVNDWYSTAYEPIHNEENEIVGVLYVGVKQCDLVELIDGLHDITVGNTGRIWAFAESADDPSVPLVGDPAEHPEFLDALHSTPTFTEATKSTPSKPQIVRLQVGTPQNPIRYVAAVSYFEPWDWKIVVAAPEHEFEDALVAAQRQSSLLTFSVIITSLIAVGSCALAATFLSKRITRRLQSVSEGLKEIATGHWDLTRRFPDDGTDEVADTAHGVNLLLEQLQQILSRVTGNAELLNSLTDNWSKTSSAMVETTSQVESQSANVSQSVQTLSSAMEEISAQANMMSNRSQSIANAIEQLNGCVHNILEVSHNAANMATDSTRLAQDSRELISQLDESAQEVAKVVAVIEDLASQTNLLALNATIESARAGEAGKGFAVVASEVKDLATQTATATDGIRERVERIQLRTAQACESIDSVANAISKLTEMSADVLREMEEQRTTTGQIAQEVKDNLESIQHVVGGVETTAMCASGIRVTFGEMEDALLTTSRDVQASRDESDRLLSVSKELAAMVEQFRV
ncbi:MAG: methyl-accepting chemotaxis protein [Planctomycetales bacterium]|nr:methyl-accepting chemotaxis protein [Planctomycetales bacterium]